MVFKLIRAGRRVRNIDRGLENDAEFGRYMVKRREAAGRIPLKDDIEILNKYIDYIKFSRPASLLPESPPVEEAFQEPLPRRGKTTLPMAFISDLTESPERWAGHHVIIDGEIEHVSTSRRGEHWHRFSDQSGTLIAVSKEPIEHKKGTLFGVARQTTVGKQLFLEIRNFHPING
jgi:hypothetical protein